MANSAGDQESGAERAVGASSSARAISRRAFMAAAAVA
jgi:hypothetical protein